jgi:hypothetical protein
MEPRDFEWTPEERREWDALPTEAPPPPGLQARIVAGLKADGLLEGRKASPVPLQWLLAASLALLLLGFGLGRMHTRQPFGGDPGNMSRYVLLLHEDSSFNGGKTPIVKLTAEYGKWARGLKGELLAGERLGDDVNQITAAGTRIAFAPEGFIGGFFVFQAANDERARAIARSCPHLRHGGRIELRRISAS